MTDLGDFDDGALGGGNGYNGRVPTDAPGARPPAPFQLFSDALPSASQSAGPTASGFMTDTMQHVWQSRDVGDATELFMSKANVDAVQEAIRYRVYVASGGKHVIGRQSDVELALVMRSVLLQRGRNDDASSAVEQVRQLNAEVLAWCVPRIVTEVNQYVRYREDVSTLPTPMAYGESATMKGSRELHLKTFF